jgi:tRNA U34 5-methylaminomethyl-2-thiouridine-forming methyltransferase MnmC
MADAETFHPVIGPIAEAEALYIRQLRLVDRLRACHDEFVVWDVGLGAAANPLTFISAAASMPRRLRVVSFDHTREPLLFALRHARELGYLERYATQLTSLAEKGHAEFSLETGLSVRWELHLRDFPSFLKAAEMRSLPKPHAIFYDAFSPQKNPAMWTLDVFTNLYRLLDPSRPCAMPTYSRSTLLRATLLLAGFFVGVGHATGEKEETTIAANSLQLIEQPLDHAWLARARRSRSAEPLHSPEYRQAPLSQETSELLSEHPQFR